MGKPRSWVWSGNHFFVKKEDKEKVYCSYCRCPYQKNASHMQTHLLETCPLISKTLQNSLRNRHGNKRQQRLQGGGVEAQDTSVRTPGRQHLINNDSQSEDDEYENDAPSRAQAERDRSPVSRPSSAMSASSSSSTATQRVTGTSGVSSPEANVLPSNPIVGMHHLNSTHNEEITQCLVQAIVGTGTPLSFVESPYWIKLFKKMRPSYTMPTRHQVANKLLQNEFDRVSEKVNTLIASARALVLEMDGWTNIRQEALENVVIDTPLPVFYESHNTKEMSHTAINLAVLADNVIKDLGPKKFLGVVTDSASNMKKMKNILQDKYPHISVWPCVAHLLHNFIKDVFSINSLKLMLKDMKNMVSEVNNKRLRVVFRRLQLEMHPDKQPRALSCPCETRFGGHVLLLESVNATKDSLMALADYRHEESKTIKLSDDSATFLKQYGLWGTVSKVLKLTSPILQWITRLEGDSIGLGEVCEAFSYIENVMDEVLPTLMLPPLDVEKIRQSFSKRRKDALVPIHFLANVLDQRYRGKSLPDGELKQASNLLVKFCEVNESYKDHKNEILIEFANYRRSLGAFHGLNSEPESFEKQMYPDIWWPTFHLTSPLCDLAVDITMLTPTSAATERVNSCYDSVQTKKRNRLVTERAGMLTFCRMNYKLLDGVKRKRPPASALPMLQHNLVVLQELELFETGDFQNLSEAEEEQEEEDNVEEAEIYEGHDPESVKSVEEALALLFDE